MAARDLRYTVLGEDREHLNFVRRWLLALGVPRRHMHEVPLPAGTGAGEQYVREQYARLVRDHRARVNHQRMALIVVVDADRTTVRDRQRLLDAQLERPRESDERIVHLIPRRNIETWLTALLVPDRPDLDESTSYKDEFPPRDAAEECRSAAPPFIEFLRVAQTPKDLPSLLVARAETQRLDR